MADAHVAETTSRIGTVAFRLLVPGYVLALLAVATSSTSWWVQSERIPVGGGPDYSDNWVDLPMNLVVSFIFAASVAINAFVLLRHPNSLTRRELPSDIARAQFTLYGLILLWILETLAVFAPGDYDVFPEIMFIVPGIAIAIVSIFVLVLARRRARLYVPRRDNSPLSTRAVLVAIAFCAVAIGAGVVTCLQPPFLLENHPFLSESITTADFAVGAPWWIVTAVIGLIPAWFNAGPAIGDLFGVAPLAVNVGMVVAGLASARFRTWFVNWFFRLGKPIKD